METSDLPLVVPLKASVWSLFADDVAELDDLKQTNANAAAAAACSSKRPGTAGTTVSSLPAGAPDESQIGGTTTAVPSPQASPKGKAPAGKKGGKSAPPPPPPLSARTPQEQSLMPDAFASRDGAAGMPSAAAAATTDPWSKHVDALQTELDNFVASTASFRAFETRRLEYLGKKTSDQYMIEDVLCEWDEPPAAIPEACIDAIAMSRAHAKMLGEKYGYVPPRGLHVAGHVRPEDMPNQGRHPDLMTTHNAGGADMDKEFLIAAHNFSAARGNATTTFDDAGVTSPTNAPRKKSTTKSLNATQASVASDPLSPTDEHSAATSSPNRKGTKAAAPPIGSKKTITSPQTRRLASVRGAGVPDLIVETSIPHFDFPHCCPGTQYELRCRIWNRDTTGRRFKLKIDGDERKLLKMQVLTPGFSSDIAVVPGNSFEISLVYSPVDTQPLLCELLVGHARDINRVDQETNTLSQWQFHAIPVSTTCVAPLLDFGANFSAEFQPCFVGASRTIRVTATNSGCAGTLVVTSSSECLTCSVTAVTLETSETVDVDFTFAPQSTDDLDATVTIRGYLPSQDPADPNAAPVSEEFIRFTGESVAPIVKMISFAEADLAGALPGTDRAPTPTSPTSAAAQLPFVVIEEACVGYTAVRIAVVENCCSLPVSVVWRVETVGSCVIQVNPAQAILQPRQQSTFTVSVLPTRMASSASRSNDALTAAAADEGNNVEAIVSLMMVGVPRIAAALAARAMHRAIVRPALRSAAGKTVPRAKDVDPFALFSPRLIEKEPTAGERHADPSRHTRTALHDATSPDMTESLEMEHFCAAVRLVADPVSPSAQVTPSMLVSDAPCLVQQANVREVILMNTGPRDLQFWLDPPSGSDHPAVELERRLRAGADVTEIAAAFATLCRSKAVMHQRHDVDVEITPQRFIVKGGESKPIKIKYAAKRAGTITTTIECYSPILEHSPVISLSLVGRGPQLTLSTNIIEYGVIPVGGEAEGRVTLTNPNPMPVVFSLMDTHHNRDSTTLTLDGSHDGSGRNEAPADSDRMVFLPSSGTLAPRESRDITIYLRGHVAGPVSDKVKISVEEGLASYVTVRANVQEPRACVTPATVCVPSANRDVPVDCVAYISNLSAVDMDFNIMKIDVPATMDVDVVGDERGLLHAGAADVPLRLRLTFRGLTPQVAVLALHSAQLKSLVLFEVTCGKVEQLRVSVGVTMDNAPKSTVTADEYCAGLLDELVLTAVMKSEKVTFLHSHETNDVVRAKCHCPPIIAAATIDDELPFALTTARVTITNLSGCYTNLRARVRHYAPPSAADLNPRATPTSPASPVVEEADGKPATTFGNTGTRLAPLKPSASASASATLNKSLQSTAVGGTNAGGAASVAASRKSTIKQSLALSSGSAGKTFVCKSINGLEEKETAEKVVLADTQRLLVHGAGFAVEVLDAEHALQPFETHEILVRLVANIPGRYTDELLIDMDDMPSTSIPISFHVEGKAVVLDPSTSGLTIGASGVAQLTMPPIVPGLAAVKRTLTITSRCPRELTVQAKLLEWGTAVSLASLWGEQGSSGGVTLSLVDRTAPGVATSPCAATIEPAALTIPALQTATVVLHYVPPAVAVNDFHASLVLTTAPSICTSNDRFFVDEFYLRNAERYLEAQRSLTQQLVIVKEGINVRGVPKIQVRAPTVERKGIVSSGAVIALDEGLALAAMETSATNVAASAGHDADDSDDDAPANSSNQSSGDVATSGKKKADADLEQRLRQARANSRAVLAERNELLAFIARRRDEMAAAWRAHVRPIELELHVTHLAPRLVTDPPAALRFPLCRRNTRNARTMTFTNEGAAAVDFMLVIAEGPFKVAKTMLRAENKGKAIDFAASKLAQSMRNRPTSRESDPASTLFRLRPFDVLEVTVELTELGQNQKHQVQGLLNVTYASGNHVQPVELLATVHVPVVEVESDSLTFRPSVAVTGGRKQPVYKRVVRLINVSPCPASFTIRHEPSDRPISRRTAVVTRATALKATRAAIENASGDGAGFEGTPTGLATGTFARTTNALGALGGAAEANNVTVQLAADDALPVDDPNHFRFDELSGTIDAASAGSKPTVLEIPVTFVEHAMMVFESKFVVDVDGGVGCSFTLTGVGRGTELEYM
jgi:hypothetical protein